MKHFVSTYFARITRRPALRVGRPLVLALAVSTALAIVFVFAAATSVAAQSAAPTGCELVLNVSWTRHASVPAGGELAVPAPPSGARIFCVDGVAAGETGAIELTNMAVFTATVGTAPVVLNISGASLASAVPLSESEQAYGVAFASRSPIPSIKLVDDPNSGVGFADVRIFWGSPKTGAGRPVGQMGSWRSFQLGATPTNVGWAEGRAREFRLNADNPVELTITGGAAFTVDGLGDPTCTRLGCTMIVTAFTGGTFEVTPSSGGWVSVEASGPVDSKLELWVPEGTPAAVAATTTNAGNNKGGGGFPTRYLPTMLRRTAP